MDSENLKLRYCFIVEWFDIHAQLTRKYEFFYYPADNTIEMYDIKQRRTFLKRTKSTITLSDLFIGSSINIHSRQLLVKDYGDEYTRSKLSEQLSNVFLNLKNTKKLGWIINELIQNKFTICQARMTTNGVLLELLGKDAPASLSKLIPFLDNVEIVQSETALKSFNDARRTATLKNCTLILLRPHLLIQGLTGKAIQDIIDAGFNITDLQIFRLDIANAEEFLEVYKGVVPEYHLMLNQLTAGPLMALEISGDEKIVETVREFVGPYDPELARKLRSGSLRAKYGLDKVKNGFHCTDLPDDGILECQYFFQL